MMFKKIAIVAGLGLALSATAEAQTPRKGGTIRMLASLHPGPGRLAAAARQSRCAWPDAAPGDCGRRAGDCEFP